MNITINGSSRPLAGPTTIKALLAELGLDPVRVAVEYNRDILPRERFAATTIEDGDTIEIVQFVGGG
jgi:thiamine biosynthesis protein ThiS